MQHKGTARLETRRLLLRPFTLADAQPMFRNWACDGEVTKFLTWAAYQSPSVADTVLADWCGRYDDSTFYQWAIAFRETPEEPIGSISVVHPIDERIQAAELGYCIGRAWWHTGITSEALRAVMDFLFDEVGVNKVVARHDTRNPNSGLVMQKCGMKYEGTLRQTDWNNQGLADASYYGLLKSER